MMSTVVAQPILALLKAVRLLLQLVVVSRQSSLDHEQKVSIYDQRRPSTKPSRSPWLAQKWYCTSVHTYLHAAATNMSSAVIHGTCWWSAAATTSRILLASRGSTCTGTGLCSTPALPATSPRTPGLQRLSPDTTGCESGTYLRSSPTGSRVTRRHRRLASTRCSCSW